MRAFLITFGKSQAARRAHKESAARLQEWKTDGRDLKRLMAMSTLIWAHLRRGHLGHSARQSAKN
jgi:hypothetical protein